MTTNKEKIMIDDEFSQEELDNLYVGNLSTYSPLSSYPGLGLFFTQIWIGDEVIARVYGNSSEESRSRAEAISEALISKTDKHHPAITHCDNCGCDWLDNGLNPIGCPYCKQLDVTKTVYVDDYKTWYEEAIARSNEAGFTGMSATQVIDYQDSEIMQLRTKLEALVEALERIESWPNGGNQYGQANIQKFAAEVLAAHHKRGCDLDVSPLKNDEVEDCEHTFKSDLAGGYFCWKCDKTL